MPGPRGNVVAVVVLAGALVLVSGEVLRAPSGDALELRVASGLARPSAALLASMSFVTFVGSMLVSVVLAGVLALFSWWRGRRLETAFVVAGLVLVTLAAGVMKVAFDRSRPAFALVVETDASYPSGHASRAALFAVAAVVAARWRGAPTWPWSVVGGAWVVVMSLSRLVLGVHYAWDVVGGALVGILVGVVLALIVEARAAGLRRWLGETPMERATGDR